MLITILEAQRIGSRVIQLKGRFKMLVSLRSLFEIISPYPLQLAEIATYDPVEGALPTIAIHAPRSSLPTPSIVIKSLTPPFIVSTRTDSSDTRFVSTRRPAMRSQDAYDIDSLHGDARSRRPEKTDEDRLAPYRTVACTDPHEQYPDGKIRFQKTGKYRFYFPIDHCGDARGLSRRRFGRFPD